MTRGVDVTDPLAYGGMAVFVIALCLLAGYLPARRIARIRPPS